MTPCQRSTATSKFLLRRRTVQLASVAVVMMLNLPTPSTAIADDEAVPVAFAVRGTPKIDGQIDDSWGQAPAVQVRQSVPHLPGSGAKDLATGIARFKWDDHHIFVLLEVNDPHLYSNSPDPWQQDSVELFLDENLARSHSFQADDTQIRINFEGKVTGQNLDPKHFRSETRRTESGYVVEGAIQLKTFHPENARQLGLELQVNDNRDGSSRGGVCKWAAADNESWNNTSRYGTLQLVLNAEAARRSDPSSARTIFATTNNSTATPNKPAAEDEASIQDRMPAWAADAIFYQIFPERFRNGDPNNDPTRAALEFPDIMPANWKVTPWTSDWYARADWERTMGDEFFEPAVFHRRYGGDLQGVLDRLDYLHQLGVNALYFNPVFYARSLHKYDGNSYHHVDPYFGPDPDGDFALMAKETSDPATWNWTAADKLFLKVIQAAHDRAMRVVVDGVFNHTGRGFFAFDDIVKQQQASPYTDWYVIQKFDDPETEANELKYQCWWGVDTLPEFANNHDGSDLHPGPKQYIFDATRRWMDPNGDGDPSDGIDGWRLDVANEVPDGFWIDWNRLVRELNPQAYTVSEIWEGAADYLRRCGFSASMNYHAFAFVGKGFLLDGRAGATSFVSDVETRRAEHPWRIQLGMQNLFDSHDTDRIASMVVNAPRDRTYVRPERSDYDIQERASPRHWVEYLVRKPNSDERRIQRLATLFQMSYIGAPMIYYGTESGMWGGDDPCDRKPMVWDDLEYDDETAHPFGKQRPVDTVSFDHELFKFYQTMVSMRKQSAALRRGAILAMTPFESAQSVAMLRKHGAEWGLVVVNRSEETQTLRLSATDFPAPPAAAQLFTTADEQPVFKVADPADVSVTIPRLSAACWIWNVQ